MKSISLRCAVVIAVLSLLVSCGGGGGGAVLCIPTANMSLHSSSTSTAPLLGITITATQNSPVTPVPVFVSYTKPPVAAIAAGYPPGGTNPQTVGMDITPVSSTPSPAQFSLSFITTGATATYEATWRFVAVDLGSNVAGCQDLPVTFRIN